MVTTLCDYPVAGDLCNLIHHRTEGFNSEIVESIAACERSGKRNGASADKPVTMQMMAGEILFYDRSGRPVSVPRGL